MMLVNRVTVANRLCLSIRATYRIFPATQSALLSSDEILGKLNDSRFNDQPEIHGEFIPQLMDAEKMADELGITARRLRSWTEEDHKRKCPYFRLRDENGANVKYLFDPLAVDEWASKKNRGRPRKTGKAKSKAKQ